MKQIALACLMMTIGTLFASAASDDAMIDACRRYAASHLNADPGVVNVSVQTARVDGTIPVNGEVEGSGITFQCSFNSSGSRIVAWWNSAPEHCPADISEANRYLYPGCG